MKCNGLLYTWEHWSGWPEVGSGDMNGVLVDSSMGPCHGPVFHLFSAWSCAALICLNHRMSSCQDQAARLSETRGINTEPRGVSREIDGPSMQANPVPEESRQARKQTCAQIVCIKTIISNKTMIKRVRYHEKATIPG
jgi:hypothetical protein